MKSSKNSNALSILVFRKWAGKGYSLFNTLHKTVKIAVLAVGYLIACPVISFASEKDTTEIKMELDLDEIEVSAKRAPAVYSQVARVITVLEAKEIEAIPAQSVEDLLEYVAGVDVRQRGAEGVQSDVSIRGGTFDQTLILLNGINITDPQTGHHNLNLPVSLNQIERVEVIEGPAARIYGPNAFSGAINIITKQPGSKHIDFFIAGGSHNYLNANTSGGFKTGNLTHLLAAGRKNSSGYIENTDFKTNNIFYTNQLKTRQGELQWQSGYSDKAFGANSFYTPKYPNQFEATRTLFGSVKWRSFSTFHLSPVLYWRRHFDRFELFRNNAPGWYTTHNYHRTTTSGAGINSWFQWEHGKTAFGAEYRNEAILSNVLGEDIETPVSIPNKPALYTKSKSRSILSIFLEHSWFKNNWIVSAGLMGNKISDNHSGLNFFPGIEISNQVVPTIKIFGSFNTSLRMPTFTDLYYKGPTNLGNPDLQPEKSATIEGGFKIQRPVLTGHLVGFYRKGKNIIDWTKVNSDDIWQPRNLTHLNSFGAEAKLQFNLKKLYGKNAPDKIMVSYLYNKIDKNTTGFISNYVLDNLKHKLVFMIDQDILKNYFINVSGTFQDREGTFTYFENIQPIGEKDYTPFWVISLKAGYRTNKLMGFASVRNIFNKKYYDLGNVIQPGRWVKAGITYNFDFN